MKRTVIILIFASFFVLLRGQQVPDTAYMPPVGDPAYAPGKGPVIFIDEEHFNFHTRGNRYLPFARLLERDGYKVEDYDGPFVMKDLKKGRILVIANALNKANVENWYKPVYLAFTDEETETVRHRPGVHNTEGRQPRAHLQRQLPSSSDRHSMGVQ